MLLLLSILGTFLSSLSRLLLAGAIVVVIAIRFRASSFHPRLSIRSEDERGPQTRLVLYRQTSWWVASYCTCFPLARWLLACFFLLPSPSFSSFSPLQVSSLYTFRYKSAP